MNNPAKDLKLDSYVAGVRTFRVAHLPTSGDGDSSAPEHENPQFYISCLPGPEHDDLERGTAFILIGDIAIRDEDVVSHCEIHIDLFLADPINDHENPGELNALATTFAPIYANVLWDFGSTVLRTVGSGAPAGITAPRKTPEFLIAEVQRREDADEGM